MFRVLCTQNTEMSRFGSVMISRAKTEKIDELEKELTTELKQFEKTRKLQGEKVRQKLHKRKQDPETRGQNLRSSGSDALN